MTIIYYKEANSQIINNMYIKYKLIRQINELSLLLSDLFGELIQVVFLNQRLNLPTHLLSLTLLKLDTLIILNNNEFILNLTSS